MNLFMCVKLLFILLIQLLSFYALSKPIPIPITVPAQDPNDGVFKINVYTGAKSCVYVRAYGEIIYPQIEYISASVCDERINAWRYDGLNRISLKALIVPDYGMLTDLCLTENLELNNGKWTLVDGNTWDYVHLRPCVTDDPRQQWRYEIGADEKKDRLINVASEHQLGENNWTLATANNPDKSLYSFKIPRAQDWLTTKAEARDYSHTLALKWFDNGTYYTDFGNSKGTLRYNPKTQQISRTDKLVLECLSSNLIGEPDSTHWAWTSWDICGDEYITGAVPKNEKWSVNSIHTLIDSDNVPLKSLYAVVLTDAEKNVLRIKTAGHNWGFPYTYRTKYVEEDKPAFDYHVTSIFFEDGSQSNWDTLAAGDKLRTLKTCPATGIETPQHTGFQFRNPPLSGTLLPPGFVLTLGWMQRIFAIINSPYDEQQTHGVGICGTCMFQALEAIVNFERFQAQAPAAVTPGLLFYSYTGTVSGLEQFTQLNPALHQRIEDADAVINDLGEMSDAWIGDSPHRYVISAGQFYTSLAMQNVMQPILVGSRLQAELTESIRAPSSRPAPAPYILQVIVEADALPALNRMLQRPSGTVWIVSFTAGHVAQRSGRYRTSGHAYLLVRYDDGIGIINTNNDNQLTEDQYRTTVLEPHFSTAEALFAGMNSRDVFFGNTRSHHFYELDIFEVTRRLGEGNYFETTLSRENCQNDTEGGAGGFGSGRYSQAPNHMNLCGDNGDRCVNYLYHSSSSSSSSASRATVGIGHFKQGGYECQNLELWHTSDGTRRWDWNGIPKWGITSEDECLAHDGCGKDGFCRWGLRGYGYCPNNENITMPYPCEAVGGEWKSNEQRREHPHCEWLSNKTGKWVDANCKRTELACLNANHCIEGEACYRWVTHGVLKMH